MTDKTAPAHQTRFERRILRLIAIGVLSVREAAKALNHHRSHIYVLCHRHGIQPSAAREAFVRRCIERAAATPESLGRELAIKSIGPLVQEYERKMRLAAMIKEESKKVTRDG
jgi:hypothetical protein